MYVFDTISYPSISIKSLEPSPNPECIGYPCCLRLDRIIYRNWFSDVRLEERVDENYSPGPSENNRYYYYRPRHGGRRIQR